MAVLVKRQLPNLLSGLFPFPHHTTTTDSTRSAGLATSETIHLTDPISATSSVSTLSLTSSAASLTESSAVSSSTTLLSTSETPSSTPTPTPTPAPVQTTSDGGTTYVTVPPSASPSASILPAPANSSNGFLQNKALSGIVFAIVGVVALILIVAIATIALRKSRRKRLHDEAVSWDPTSLGGAQLDRGSTEKRRFSLLSSDNGHSGPGSNSGGGYSASAAPTTYGRQPYYPAMESQHSLIGNSQQPWYGGAAANGPYGATHAPQSDLRPGWMYGNDVAPPPPSKSPSP